MKNSNRNNRNTNRNERNEKPNKEDFKKMLAESLNISPKSEKQEIEEHSKIERRQFNRNSNSNNNSFNSKKETVLNKIPSLDNVKDRLSNINSSDIKTKASNVLKLIAKHPLLALVMVFVVIVLSNMTLINKTIILNNIDNIKTDIISIEASKAIENTFFEEKVSSLESKIAELNAEISEINSSKEIYNEEISIKILEKKESLNNNIAKLDILGQ